ncbi:MAG TPA: CHAT domain-containing tetratricopeptide repeat protein [Pyrinomonadaceae bacterium]|nr:CHAT domain-containing tetratricopeptide repeat protein [Pyrinomonadaceae bacterium]
MPYPAMCWGLLFLLTVAILAYPSLTTSTSSAHGPGESSQSETTAAQNLVLHQWTDREIASDEVHSYQIESDADQYFSIEIERWGLSISGGVSSPAERESTKFTCRPDDVTLVSVITSTSGKHVISLRAAASPLKVGRYRIRLKESRVKSKWDPDRVAVESMLAAADQLRATQTDDSNRKAIEKYQEALALLKGLPDPQLEANVLKGLGQTYEALNDNKLAVTHYRRALSLSRRIKNHKSEAAILNCLSSLEVLIGNNSQALSGAESALRSSRLAGSRTDEARALFISGEANYGLGDLKKTLEFDQQALNILREFRDYHGQAEVLLNLGYAYSSLSRTEESRQSYQEAVRLTGLAQDPRLEARSLRALATFQARLGEYQQALDLFQKSLKQLNSIDDRLTKATVLGGMAFTYKNLGELQKALEYINQSIALFQEIGNTWGEAEAQMDAGRISFSLGNGQEALSSYERALTLFRQLGMTRLQAQTLRDMGVVYDSWNNRDEALKHYNHSLRLTRPGQDQRYQAYTFNYIGRVYEASGENSKAIDHYRRALQLNRVAEDPAGEALSLFNLAHVQRDMNLLDDARAQIETGLKISESLRSKVASQNVRASLVASTHQYFELHADILMRLHLSRPNEGFAAAAFEASEKARARSLLELLREARADIRQGVDASLLAQERRVGQELNSQAERHAELILSGQKDEALKVAGEVDRLTGEYEEIETQIRTTSPRYAALTQPEPLTLKEIQRQVLDDDSLLLEYMLGDDRSYVWAVTRHEIAAFELPGREQIEDQARAFHKLLTANQAVPGETITQNQERVKEANAQLPKAAASFSRVVLEPVLTRLGKKRLLIVADGALQYIPFQALVVPPTAGNFARPEHTSVHPIADDLIPLIRDHEIVNEPSASTLALLMAEARNRKPSPRNVAVLADPVFEADDPRIDGDQNGNLLTAGAQETEVRRVLRDVNISGQGGSIPRLFASADEADAIMSVTPWRSGFKAIGFDASRATAMSSTLGDYRIVHFATHGFVNNDYPALSGVVLSLFDQKGQQQDGFLRLHDIYNLKLPVELVVLSACNTGLGKEVKGEGFIGLTRGFMYAGASSVVASLWKVDDQATAELMRLFYTYMLRDGLSPAAALRKAQMTMSQQKRWESPYFWAGFVIQGQYLQSERPSRFPISYLAISLLAGVVLAAAGIYALKRRRKFAL